MRRGVIRDQSHDRPRTGFQRVTSWVFDLDGTISDPRIGIGRSLNYALRALGYAPIADDEVPRYIGPPLDDTFRALARGASAGDIIALVAKYRERYADIGYAENVVYPGMPETLRGLAATGVAIGLCTSKRVDFAERILALFGIREHFRFVSGGDIGIRKHEQLASLLGEGLIDRKSTMIGDRAVDILAAKANHLRSIGVLWGHGSLDELRTASPELLLESPRQLIEHAA
jgi:phosphoglycolate phosphatase